MIKRFEAQVPTVDAFTLAKQIAYGSGVINALREDDDPESAERLENIDELLGGVQEFCEALGLSRSVASKHLNAEAGLPVGQFIRNYRLNMAKELLSAKTGNRNITEIAYKVGFNDPKYFTRCFTKMFGISPSAYTEA